MRFFAQDVGFIRRFFKMLNLIVMGNAFRCQLINHGKRFFDGGSLNGSPFRQTIAGLGDLPCRLCELIRRLRQFRNHLTNRARNRTRKIKTQANGNDDPQNRSDQGDRFQQQCLEHPALPALWTIVTLASDKSLSSF